MHNFGYTEEMIQTRSIENMKEKQESHETLFHKRIKNGWEQYYETIIKNDLFEKKILDCETKLDQFRDILSNTVKEEDNIKNKVHFLYEKVLLDTFFNKDQVFESYIKCKEDYLLKKLGKEVVIDGNCYYLSDLDYETPRENLNHGLIEKDTVDMVDKKHRMKTTKNEIFRILNEQKTRPKAHLWRNNKQKTEGSQQI